MFYKSFLPDLATSLLIMIFIIKDEPGLDFWKVQTIQPLQMTQHPILLLHIHCCHHKKHSSSKQNKAQKDAKSGEPVLILGVLFF